MTSLNDFLDLLFPEEGKRRKENRCPFCAKPIGPFRDELSRKEFGISGLCQKCQDEVFAEPPEDPYIDGRDDDWREW